MPAVGVEPTRCRHHGILSFHLPITSNHSTSLQITFHHSEITQYRRFRTIKFQKWRFSAVSKTHQKCLEKEFFGRKLAELDFRQNSVGSCILTIFATRLLVNNKKSTDENLLRAAKSSLFLPFSIKKRQALGRIMVGQLNQKS